MNPLFDSIYIDTCRLFEHIPGICFFAKDENLKYQLANRNLLTRYGLADETEIIDLSDYDFHPDHLATEIREVESEIMKTGETVNRIEACPTSLGVYEWCSVVRIPLRNDSEGEVTGVVGIFSSLQSSQPTGQNLWVAQVTEWLARNLEKPFRIDKMAGELGISSRQLQRIFQKEVGTSVADFVTRSRVMAAAKLLRESALAVGEVAIQVGFCDHSALNRHFKKYFGCTPTEFKN